MLLRHADVNFIDKRIPKENWPSVKQTMPNGQMPAWEENGMLMGETPALLRYFGKKYGYYPTIPN